MKVGELLANWFEVLNIDTTDETLKDLVGIGVEVPNEIVESLQKNLLTFDSAKTDPKIKSHFKASLFDGFDKSLKAKAELLGVDLTEFESNDTTNKKLEYILNKALEKQKDKKGEDLTKAEIEKLNKQISDLNTSFQDREKQLLEDFNNKIINKDLEIEVNSFGWSDIYDKQDRKILGQNSIQSKLNELKAKIVTDSNGNLKLVHSDNQDLNFYVNNKELQIKDLVGDSLAKYAKQSPSQPNTPPTVVNTTPITRTTKVEDLIKNNIEKYLQ